MTSPISEPPKPPPSKAKKKELQRISRRIGKIDELIERHEKTNPN